MTEVGHHCREECCIFGVPAITVRDTTECPETVECGSNMLSGVEPAAIRRCVMTVLECLTDWDPPREYLAQHVSGTVARIVLGSYGVPVPGRSPTHAPAAPSAA